MAIISVGMLKASPMIMNIISMSRSARNVLPAIPMRPLIIWPIRPLSFTKYEYATMVYVLLPNSHATTRKRLKAYHKVPTTPTKAAGKCNAVRKT